MDLPRVRRQSIHLPITVLGNQQVRPGTIIKNAEVVWIECRCLIQRRHRLIGSPLSQFDHAEPHPGIGVVGIEFGFTRNRSPRMIQLAHLVLRDAEKEVRSWRSWIQFQRFANGCCGILQVPFAKKDQTEIQVTVGQTRRELNYLPKMALRSIKITIMHSFCAESEFILNVVVLTDARIYTHEARRGEYKGTSEPSPPTSVRHTGSLILNDS